MSEFVIEQAFGSPVELRWFDYYTGGPSGSVATGGLPWTTVMTNSGTIDTLVENSTAYGRLYWDGLASPSNLNGARTGVIFVELSTVASAVALH